MSRYSLDLLFLDGKETSPSIAHICVKTVTTGGYKGVNPDLPLISPQCMTYAEVVAQADRLIAELNSIKAEAKRKFGKK